jgi:hypothetical protein
LFSGRIMAESFSEAQWTQFPEWPRGPARIEGEDVVLLEDRAQFYYIHEPDDLLSDLAGLWSEKMPRTRLERAVLSFVRRHGLLWHGREDVGRGECRESLREWLEASWNIREIAIFHQRLMKAVEANSTAPLKTLETAADWEKCFTNPPRNERDYLAQASTYLTELVNQGMRGSERRIAAACAFTVSEQDSTPLDEPGVFFFEDRPPTLEAAAYTHFAHLIVACVELLECSGCGRPFLPQSGKQKYCTESCASTSRWRRWKEKQANPT